MAKTKRPTTDTKTPAASPNPREKQRNRPDPDPENPKEIEHELTPKVLNNDFEMMSVEDASPVPTTENCVLRFDILPIIKANAFYLSHKDASVKAMTAADFFGEDPACFHQLNRHSKAAAGPPGAPVSALSVSDYKKIFHQAFAAPQDDPVPNRTADLKHLALRMVLADPVALFTPFAAYWSATYQLRANDMSHAWVAAYQLFGAPWKNRDRFFVPSPALPKAPPPSTIRKVAQFDASLPADAGQPKKLTPAVKNPYRIIRQVRPMVDPDAVLQSKLKTPHVTFIFVILPRLKASEANKQYGEVVSLLETFLKHLTAKDPKAQWFPWRDTDSLRDPPLGKGRMHVPPTKAGLLAYSEKGAFTSQGQSPIIRVRIGHHLTPDDLFGNSSFVAKLRANSMTVEICPIQSSEEILLGHMLGSHPLVFKDDNWREAHSLIPDVGTGHLDFRLGEFITDRSQLNVPYGDRHKDPSPGCVEVYAALNRAGTVRNALLTVYSSKNPSNSLPMGFRMRFILNILSDRFICSDDERRIARKARSIQTRFLANMEVFHNYQIVGLRFPLEEYDGITLHDALSGLRSRKDPETNLFYAMEDVGSSVAFLYHRDRANEAMSLIPALPRVLEVLVGPNIWPWFDVSAKDSCVNYKFDPARGIVNVDEKPPNLHMHDIPGATDDYSLGSLDDDLSDDEDDIAYRLQLHHPGAIGFDDGSIKTAHLVDTAADSPTVVIPTDVAFNASPLSSTTGPTPTLEAILAATQNDPAILAAILAHTTPSPGRSPDTERPHE